MPNTVNSYSTEGGEVGRTFLATTPRSALHRTPDDPPYSLLLAIRQSPPRAAFFLSLSTRRPPGGGVLLISLCWRSC